MLQTYDTLRPSFQRTGRFETFGVERNRLPDISVDAKTKLLGWGLTEEHISALQEFSANFRYDLCKEKIEELTSTPVYLTREGETEFGHLPHFFDVKGRLDGQCSDIANQFIIQANMTGLLDYLNTSLPPNSHFRIGVARCQGLSATHFCKERDEKESDVHIWNSLVFKGRNGQIFDSVLVDAAFQIIKTEPESGYKLKERISNIGGMEIPLEISVEIGTMRKLPSGFEISYGKNIVLGMSTDRKYSYSMGFVRYQPLREKILSFLGKKPSDSSIITVIIRGLADGSAETFLLSPFTGDFTQSNNASELLPHEKQELLDLLVAAQKYQFTSDLTHYPTADNNTFTISWKQ